MNSSHTLPTAILCIFLTLSSFAQTKLDCNLVVDSKQALGLDMPYDFSPAKLSSPPKGYKEFFIEHYGRHGSRYAYSSSFYTVFHNTMSNAAEKGLLTPFGQEIFRRYAQNHKNYMNRMGDLSPLGREQQKEIARRLYKNFPGVFNGNPTVKSSASMTARSIMSMSSFDLGLMSMNPKLDIDEETGRVFLDGTNPRMKNNPFRVKRYCPPFPFKETRKEFQYRKLNPDIILGKLFTDINAAFEGLDKSDFLFHIYVLTAGMESLPEEERTDFTGLFSEEEMARMWEIHNYHCFIEYHNYLGACLPVLLDIQRDANERISSCNKGATFRFGHDHVMFPLLLLLEVNGFSTEPSCPDQVALAMQSWESCMATNLQFVFYRPAGKGKFNNDDIIFKLLLNGREANLPLKAVSGHYYRFSDLEKQLEALQRKYKQLPA